MTTINRAGPVLAAELAELNDDQRKAVFYPADCVVRAGPGSGKTRTLVAKVGYLLDVEVPARQSVAAITYTREAAREIISRLDRFHIRPGRRLVCGTLHSWCMSTILRPYGPLVGLPVPAQGRVIDDKDDEWITLLQKCLDAVGLSVSALYEKATITKLRRELAAGYIEDVSSPSIRAAILFEERMLAEGWCDYEAMIIRSLRIVREHPVVAQLIAARFPWLVVDEYQDLGPVLHALVLTLHDEVGVQVAAFGDPDQSLMGFTGADPRYLNELVARDDFEDLPLHVNYRCGQAIVAASHAALGEQRTYTAHPERVDHGVIDRIAVDGGLDGHATAVVEKVAELTDAGVARHNIAILYPRKGVLLTELIKGLDSAQQLYVHERDESLPDGDLADFIRGCAARALSGRQPASVANSVSQTAVSALGDLTRDYLRLREASDLTALRGRSADRALATFLNNFDADKETPLESWLNELTQLLDLGSVASRSPVLRDRQAVTGFLEAGAKYALSLNDIAAGALRTDKITLTTYHSAKGREWDVVILPGLVDGIMPLRPWSQQLRKHREPAPDKLEQDRRSFYVGLTRAKIAVILIYGSYWETGWGAKNKYGISRFVRDVLVHLGGG